MGWTNPSGHNYAASEVVTATTLNTYVRDNLIDLDRRTTPSRETVSTSESTGSTLFADLATNGPAATVTIGASGMALVGISAQFSQSSDTRSAIMTFSIAGATTVSAGSAPRNAGAQFPTAANASVTCGATFVVTDLNPGITTFTAKYAVGVGGIATFANRHLWVLPIGS